MQAKSTCQQPKSGFTIVELLIVIVVIGILAAISIVTYSNVQQKARDSMRRDAVNTIGKVLQVYSLTTGNSPKDLGGGAGGGSTYGWFDYAYGTSATIKQTLVDAELVNISLGDPAYKRAQQDYFLWHSQDLKAWAVTAKLEAPSSQDLATRTTLALDANWSSALSGCSPGISNYIRTFSVSS